MSMPALPLAFVGWFFAIASFAALAIGVLLLLQLFRSGKISPDYLRTRIIGDFALLGVWLIGLVSAFGLLNGHRWGYIGLEYFCWVLIALILLSGATRLAAHARHAEGAARTARGWLVAIAAVMLVALPLLALCSATIATLRGDAARAQFGERQSQ